MVKRQKLLENEIEVVSTAERPTIDRQKRHLRRLFTHGTSIPGGLTIHGQNVLPSDSSRILTF